MIVAVVIAQINSKKKFRDLNGILTAMAQGCVSTQQIGLLPMYGSSQLNWLEHCSANAEAMGSNRV